MQFLTNTSPKAGKRDNKWHRQTFKWHRYAFATASVAALFTVSAVGAVQADDARIKELEAKLEKSMEMIDDLFSLGGDSRK